MPAELSGVICGGIVLLPHVYVCFSKIVDPSRSPCLETVDRKSFEYHNFLVLRPVPLKIAYFNSANRQLSIDVRPNELR